MPRLEKSEVKKVIGRRLALECSRLELSQIAAAEVAGCSRRSWGYYESGSSTLDSVQLSALDRAGFDVLYIVTGRRSRRTRVVERADGGKALALPPTSI